MNKQEIYKQIDEFVNKREGKSKLYEIRYYVDTATSENLANFVKWVFENNEDLKNIHFESIIDLCYGSGNLTVHILFDSILTNKDLTLENLEKILTLNDKNKDDCNNNIAIGRKTHKDFLDSNNFDERKYDLIIFNPQIGGEKTYAKGAVKFEDNITPIVFEGTFNDYLKKEGIDITELDIEINKNERKILIYSEKLSKSKMNEIFKNIKVFNYYDIFYKSKDAKQEGKESNIVKFRKTLDEISEDKTIIIFFGEEKFKKALFADYSTIKYLTGESKNLYILLKSNKKDECFEKSGNKFIECKEKKEDVEVIESLDEIIGDIEEIVSDDDGIEIKPKEKEKIDQQQEQEKCKFSTQQKGSLDFKYKNILFKGVPGTGKSRMVNQIIKNRLKLKLSSENVLRINVHSATSNADLMQGIGISSNNGQINYEEKQGLIMDLIQKATFRPRQPFVLVLEEVQENSLNELIGDLIYLIEDEKRSDLFSFADDKEYSYQELVDRLVNEGNIKHYVKIPYLVSSKTEYRKMILPNNLYVFCTSNYRDDKKVIEDNLLRRFEVVEIYPQYERGFKDIDVAKFLEEFNRVVLEVFEYEIHPDRFQIGHANWLYIDDKKGFYKALLKAVIEFKEIREIEYLQGLKKIFEKIKLEDGWVRDAFYELKLDEKNSYEKIINELQEKVYDEILGEQNAKNE